MSSIIHSMLGVTPSIKIVPQMNEKLLNDNISIQREENPFVSVNKDMVSIPITTSIATSGKQKQTSKWEWSKFKNSARNDSLLLFHWAKRLGPQSDSDIPNAEASNSSVSINNSETLISSASEGTSQKESFNNYYYFSKFNRHPMVYSFKSDQYNKHLKDIDSDWSEEDTNLLFELCKEYDLRFIVIHDRYFPPSGIQRSLEQLKQRYYSISKKLVEASFDAKRRSLGNSPDPSTLMALKDERNRHPYIRYNYNIDFDKNRRLSLSESYCKNLRKETKEIMSELHSKSHSIGSKKTFSQASKFLEDLIEIENEIDIERKLISKLKNCDNFGPKKSGATTAGTLCYQYVSSLPRKFPSDVENLLKHFKLEAFPLTYFNTEIAEQYCIIRCDLLVLLSTRKKLQRLNTLKHLWQEKMRSLSQIDELCVSVQTENEDKGKNILNPSNRQFQAMSASPATNIARTTQRPRNKTLRNTQEQVQMMNQAHIEANAVHNVSQFSQNPSDILKRESDSADRPKKKFKHGTSKYTTQNNGYANQTSNQKAFQGIGNTTQSNPKNNDLHNTNLN
ncbi:DNMAP1 like Myb domain [Cryptosporidium ryanae]|uniref:DNMAP1 like Myb domain n=1 Tax=Cryptosporidium ryanae TaxID=515981 RepID=UPI00351A85CF|nr:DNMAP1 like Myb domain [Cryptosporidium ryanae]